MSDHQNFSVFPCLSSKEEVLAFINHHIPLRNFYVNLSDHLQRIVLDFFLAKRGSRVTYDSVFKKLFDPALHPDRLEALLSSILKRSVKIIRILPREGTQMREQASFVIMDVLVQLDDGSYANVEMQKIGYSFPLARTDCYASDIILRQYAKMRAEQGRNFNFQMLQKVYCIILMEKSPKEFHSVENTYIHKRTSSFDTGIFPGEAGLHEDIFICLDSFRSIVHTITKESNILNAWLMFLSAADAGTVNTLMREFPKFIPLYQELIEFMQNPEELMKMLSEELYMMDKNTERLMVEELQEEVAAVKAERDALAAKAARADLAEAKLKEVLAYALEHGYQQEKKD